MQDIFPEQVQSEPQFFLERLKQPGSMPAPEGGFPRLEGFNVVSVRLREAMITATPQNGANAHEGAHNAIPHNQMYSAASAPTYGSAPAYNAPANPTFVSAPAKPRRRLFGRDLAIWICVAQLGVIIWWLVGPGMEKQRERATNAVRTAVMLPIFGKPTPTKGTKPSGKAKKSGRKGFVPPPPPEVAHSSKLMIPPPPVAFALPSAGAAAASTLPQPKLVEPPPAARPTPHAVPTEQSAEAPRTVAQTAAIIPTEENESSQGPVPDWVQKIPSYNWHDAMNGVATTAAPEQDAEPPVAVPHQQPFRTVMAGNRKRTIADR